jgi:glycosyltransferase involved in cell wall biosynthesis
MTQAGAGPKAELVSLVIMAWRQEPLLREVIAAAFAQTYQPLEIVLSDDASPDGSFAIMQEMAGAYTGPHIVRLNCNPQNLGLIGHVNRVFELAQGVLLVYNAGDDISHPDRVARLYAAFADTRPGMVHSNVVDMDGDGKDLPRQRDRQRHLELDGLSLADLATTKNNCIGASCAWSPRLHQVFGPITETGLFEDRVLYFRARLLGDVAYVDDRLLRYRRGTGLSFDRGTGDARTQRNYQIDLATLRQRRLDCLRVAPDAADVLKALDAKIAKRVAQLATKSNPVANPEKAARPSREDRDARRAQKARRMTKNAVTPVS